MTAEDGLVLSRFVHFSALLFAFGVSFFPLYAFSTRKPLAAFNIRSRFKTSLLSACFIALASGLPWLVFTAASMADSLSEAFSSSTLIAVLGESGFGRVWTFHVGLVISLCILAGLDHWHRRSSAILIAVLSGACLASLALTGHTQEQEGLSFLVRVTADGAHLLAAGAWLGGLVTLLAVLLSSAASGDRSEGEISHVLMRFSGMGYGAVAILVGTGLVNTWYLVPSLSYLGNSLYGQILVMKLALFALMLLLAALNRFWFVPAIAGPNAKKTLVRLRQHVIGEQLLGVFIIALVSVLGTLAPFGEQ
jgi:putative copper resistance protein D